MVKLPKGASKELKRFRSIKEALEKDLWLGEKKTLIGDLLNDKPVFDRIIAAIIHQEKIIRKKYSKKGEIKFEDDVKRVLSLFSQSQNDEGKLLERLYAMLVSEVQVPNDGEALEMYNEFFHNTLKEEEIGKKKFGDQKEAFRIEEAGNQVIEHLLVNLDKQRHAVEELKRKKKDSFETVAEIKDKDGGNLIDKLKNLIAEEERFHLTVIRDEELFENAELAVLQDIGKEKLSKSENKRLMGALARLAVRGSIVGFLAFKTIVFLLFGPSVDKTRPVIIERTIERYLKKDVKEVIDDLPKAEREAITKITSKEADDMWNKNSGRLIEELKRKYADEITKQFFDEFNRQKAELEAKGKTIDIEYTQKEVWDAVYETLRFMKVEMLEDIRPKNFLDWVKLTGGSPRWTGRVEQHIREKIMDRAEPAVAKVKQRIREKIGTLLIPEFIKTTETKKGSEQEKTVEDWFLDNAARLAILLFIVGSITANALLNRIPLVGKIYKWGKKQVVGVPKDVWIVLKILGLKTGRFLRG